MAEMRVDDLFTNAADIGDEISFLMPAFDGEFFEEIEEEFPAEEPAATEEIPAPVAEAMPATTEEPATEPAAETDAEEAVDVTAVVAADTEDAPAAEAAEAEAPAEEAEDAAPAEGARQAEEAPMEEPLPETKPAKKRAPRQEGPEELTIHYLEAGVGEPLLLIHGIGQSLYTWHAVFSELSESYRVIAIDLPGHGYSSRPERYAYSMDETAEAIYRFLQAKGIQSAHMIGFSTGAIYMMRLITLHEDCVANCIAIAPGGISKHMPKLYHRMKGALGAVFTRNLYSKGDVRNILRDCYADESILTEHDVNEYYNPVSDGLTREAMTYAATNFDLKGTVEDLRYSDHEILCVWGREDRLHPASGSVYFQDVLQNGRYYMVKDAGHLVQEEAPERIVDVVLSYIPPAVGNY